MYDNLGVEPLWKSHAVVLVSDGSGIFQGETDQGLFWRIKRYQAVQEEQTRGLRRRSLRIGFKKGSMRGATWSVGSTRAGVGADSLPRYSRAFAREVLAKVRTDLDAFSDVEAGVLMNHGYLSAAGAIAARLPELRGVSEVPRSTTNPRVPRDDAASGTLAASPVPLPCPPFPDLLPPAVDELGLRAALRESGARRMFGR